MTNLYFVMWMILYPLTVTIGEILTYRYGERRIFSDNTRGMAALFTVILWFYVGSMLYVAV